ncbi:CaiB/BaiF CoA transferase family protein [Microvirga pudoricolor]|uniref:CaiB/BaiF CoA transferase family protein n=1 Tax=Microvirga pudoricolor TaxID=2778729 RepID=UPI00194FFA21|nr:CaiB/BaiF CoA-transferase family protein [Microvirga pudoricolor]MBM6595314.1 CoA transferase [Microvirga pudoricolor]
MGPFADLRIVEFTHTVMGPAAGMLFAELGADVIRIETPPKGDRTRYLGGSGAGYFAFYNRHKKSVLLDLKTEAGRDAALKIIGTSDALIENFAPGTMDRLGLGYETVKKHHPHVIYCALKGFLAGPYESRLALDEVVQVMSGLAYMTGPPGQPLRAGASIIDVMGGLAGSFAVLAALRERDRTGKGQLVQGALYESAVFLMGQHMVQSALQGSPVMPMSVRDSAWAIYRIYATKDGGNVFVGITTDETWERFCSEFGRGDLAQRSEFSTNAARREHRAELDAEIAAMFMQMTQEELVAACDRARIPFGPVGRPEDLFQDPHLVQSKQLVSTILPTGASVSIPTMPLRMETWAPEPATSLPHPGAHTREVLKSVGLSEDEISNLAPETAT